jgi:hypothetical protein
MHQGSGSDGGCGTRWGPRIGCLRDRPGRALVRVASPGAPLESVGSALGTDHRTPSDGHTLAIRVRDTRLGGRSRRGSRLEDQEDAAPDARRWKAVDARGDDFRPADGGREHAEVVASKKPAWEGRGADESCRDDEAEGQEDVREVHSSDPRCGRAERGAGEPNC